MNDRISTAPVSYDFGRFFDHNLDLLCIADTGGFFRKLNPRWEAVLGYSVGELEGQRFLDLVHPDDLPATLEAVRELAATRNVINFANRYRHRDGSYRWLEWCSSSDGTLIYATAREMTGRKQAETKLEESEKRFRTLFDTMHEGFAFHEVICNDAGKVVDYRYLDLNPAFEQLTGLKRETTVGRTVREVLPDIEEEWIQCFGRVALSGIPDERENYVQELDRYYRARAYSPEQGKFAVVFEDITDQRRIQWELEQREAQLRVLFESSHAGIILVDLSGRITMANQRMAEMFGCPLAEVIGSSYPEHVHPDQRHQGDERMRQLICGEISAVSLERHYIRKDGSDFWGYLSGRRHEDSKGKLISLVGHITDITDRMKSEIELLASKEFLNSILENIPNMIFVKDADDLRFVSFNRAGEELLGISRTELIGRNDYDFFPKEEADFFTGRDREVLATGNVLDIPEETIQTKHGRKILHTRKIAIKSDNGIPLYLVGISEDITESKQLLEDLQQSEQKYRSLFATIQDAVFVTDVNDNGRIIECNEQHSGYTREELLGKSTVELGLWGNLEERQQVIDIVRRQGHVNDFETTFRRKDGTLFCGSVSTNVLSLGSNMYLLSVVRDITDRKKSEEERSNLERQLLHAQKLESLGVLAGGIAHDFNNILTAIVGNAELALRRLNPESPVLENLERIEKAAARAAELARQMLAYSGKGKFVVEALDLNRLVEEMGHMLEVSISKKALLRYNLTRPLPTINADATQIRQIVMNLVINASEAIGDKSGVIVITTGCLDCDRSYLKNAWLDENIAEGLYVYLEITDTGCGMDQETLAKIFDPFFTTKFTGRGLGMAAVLGIVRGHKGAIKVYSEPNKGSSFKILLPASSRPVELFNGTALDDGWKGSGKVLLVDDEENVRGICGEMLKELGFEVVTANDGREAVEKYKANPDVRLVLLDLTMPHMDGEQCFSELCRMNPDITVIMSSGYTEYEVTQKFAGKRVAGFIQKPYNLSTLKEVVRKVEQVPE